MEARSGKNAACSRERFGARQNSPEWLISYPSVGAPSHAVDESRKRMKVFSLFSTGTVPGESLEVIRFDSYAAAAQSLPL
jgi:hypothetical protein